jgi:hypothetical protein
MITTEYGMFSEAGDALSPAMTTEASCLSRP